MKPFNRVDLISPDIIREGDRVNYFLARLTKDGSPVDVSNSNVTWSMANKKGRVIADKTADKTNDLGVVKLGFGVGDQTGYGKFEVQIEVENGSVSEFYPSDNSLEVFIPKNINNLEHTPVAFMTVDKFTSSVTATLNKSSEALSKAGDAKIQSQNTQSQLDEIILESGTSDAELVQARGKYDLLYKRLEELDDYTATPQSPKPQKNGVKECTYKLIRKTSSNALEVVQKTNKGYVHYRFEKNNGASQAGRDYGQNHELIRIVKAIHIQDAYVYKDLNSPVSGTISTQYAAGKYNNMEAFLYSHLTQKDDTKSISSKTDDVGMACYRIEPSTEVTYNLPTTTHNKANILFMCSSGGSTDVQIKVNGVTVKTFNPRAFLTSGNTNSAYLAEFDVPSKMSGDEYTVTIRNNASSGLAYPACINYYPLNQYSGQPISDYKCFGSAKTGWITNPGASDYALFDESTNMWFGSYHGGEISEYDRIRWDTSALSTSSPYELQYVQFLTITAGEWRVQKEFDIYQQTSLANGQAKMVSKFEFNSDGTLEMDFGYYDGQVVLSVFYTALTCTETKFNYVFYPKFLNLGSVPANGFVNIPTTEGKISQINATDTLQLDLRFTRFNQSDDVRGVTIADNAAYRKVYYGPVYGSSGRMVESLSFSKGMDFIVR